MQRRWARARSTWAASRPLRPCARLLQAVAGPGAEAGRRDPPDARRQLPAAQRRVRFRLFAAVAPRTRAVRSRARPHRSQLQPVPRPAAVLAHGVAGLHGAVQAHAAVQAAGGVRGRGQRARTVEPHGVEPGRPATCRAPPGFQAPSRFAERIQSAAGDWSSASPRSRRRTPVSKISSGSSTGSPIACCTCARRGRRAHAGERCDPGCRHAACPGLMVPEFAGPGRGPGSDSLAEEVVRWQRRARPAPPAVAGHAGPLPHLAVGGDAAADAGHHRARLLRALSAAIS
jgi:hypothetical protein